MSLLYCNTLGCENSSVNRPEYAFFTLPREYHRRAEWLRLMCREDLMKLTPLPPNTIICEAHFHPTQFNKIAGTKYLKETAVPTVNLPAYHKKLCGTQTEFLSQNKFTQTFVFHKSTATQTNEAMSNDFVKIQRLKSDLYLYRRKLKFYEVVSRNPVEVQLKVFQDLCDKFLSKNFAEIVKSKVRNIDHNEQT